MKKAYAYDDEQEGTTEIYWAETAGQAKAYFAGENNLPYQWIRVYRAPWADKYNDMNAYRQRYTGKMDGGCRAQNVENKCLRARVA